MDATQRLSDGRHDQTSIAEVLNQVGINSARGKGFTGTPCGRSSTTITCHAASDEKRLPSLWQIFVSQEAPSDATFNGGSLLACEVGSS
jgi:hypothetical protein